MNYLDAIIALIVCLFGIIGALVSYIFTRGQKVTDARLAHHDALIEEMVKSNISLSSLVNEHEYRIKGLEKKSGI